MHASLCSILGCQVGWAEDVSRLKSTSSSHCPPSFDKGVEEGRCGLVCACEQSLNSASCLQDRRLLVGAVLGLVTRNSFKGVTHAHFCSALTQFLILPMELNGAITNYTSNDVSF